MRQTGNVPPKAGTSRLGCVALPIIAGDIAGNLGEVFALWADDRFRPFVPGGTPPHKPHLLIVVNSASEAQLAQITTLYRTFPVLASSFSGISVHSAQLEGARDTYAPDGDGNEAAGGPVLGRKAGPNFLFQRVIELGAEHGGFTLQLELDCLPVGPGWLGATGMVISDHPRAWVIGSHYGGAGLLGPDAKFHLNGNALYQGSDPRFKAFFDGIWMPRLLYQIRKRPDLAYDWWWSVERFEADALSNNISWQLFQTYDSFFHADPFVVNLAVPGTSVQAYARIFDQFAGLGQPPVFLHGPAMNVVRRDLLEQPQSGIFDVIDSLDPPKVSPKASPETLPGLPRTMRGAGPAEGNRQSAALPPDQLLLAAAADLLNSAPGAGLRDSERSAETRESERSAETRESERSEAPPNPDRAQAISAARDALSRDHPARVHYDRVRAHIGDPV